MITSNAAVPGAIGAKLSVRGSAVSASTYSVPAGFLWLTDLLVQCGALLVAWQLSPLSQKLFSVEVAGQVHALARLSLRPAAQAVGLLPFREIFWIPFVMVPVTLLSVQMLGGYRALLEQSRTRVVLSSIIAPLFGLSVVTLVLILTRNQFTSRALIFSFTIFSGAGLLSARCLIRSYKYYRLLAGHYARNIVVIARAPARAWLWSHFAQTVSQRLHRLAGYLEVKDASTATASDAERDSDAASGMARLGDLDDLGDLLIHQPIHEVIAVQSPGAEAWLPGVMERCEYFKVTLRLVPEPLLSWHSRDLPIVGGGDGLRLPEIVLKPRNIDAALFAKRVLDMIISAALLVGLAPIFLIVAIAIKLTTPKLSVLYPWRVVGFKGRTFTGYKFTTMIADADDLKADLMHLNEMQGPVFKIQHDPRVTALGRVLRKFSINELPQLWSVLRGDMSLVGPRPAYPHELERYELWQKRKLCVTPGVTCLWQVRGRNKISSFDDWVRMDFEYIDNWSLWLDCKILFKTIFIVFAGSGS